MKKKVTVLLLIVSFLVLFPLFFFYVPVQKAVVFYHEHTSKISAYLPINSGESFQIIFTHSIHLSDVIEKYRVTKDNKIEQYEIVFEEFGIGMPSNAEEGQKFVYEDGKYHVKNLNNIFPYMNIRNGRTVSKHRLVWGENEQHKVWFNEYFAPGDWFTVKVEDLTLWQLMKGVKIHDWGKEINTTI